MLRSTPACGLERGSPGARELRWLEQRANAAADSG
jgi:hypothetical protein